MKKIPLLLIFSCLLAFSCSDEDVSIQSCNVDNVLTDLPWLHQKIEESEQSDFSREYNFITIGTLDSKTVFMLRNCCPFCLSTVPVYDCNGNVLGAIGMDDLSGEEITDERVIWKSSGNSCNI